MVPSPRRTAGLISLQGPGHRNSDEWDEVGGGGDHPETSMSFESPQSCRAARRSNNEVC